MQRPLEGHCQAGHHTYHDGLQRQLALSQLGQVQNIVHKPLHVECAHLDGCNVVLLLQTETSVFSQEANHRKDGVEGVPQLVAGCDGKGSDAETTT